MKTLIDSFLYDYSTSIEDNDLNKPTELEMKDLKTAEIKKVYYLNKIPLSFYQQVVAKKSTLLPDSLNFYEKSEIDEKKEKRNSSEYKQKITHLNQFLQSKFPQYQPKENDNLCYIGKGSKGGIHLGITEDNEFLAIKKLKLEQTTGKALRDELKKMSNEIQFQYQNSEIAPTIFGLAVRNKPGNPVKNQRYIGMELLHNMESVRQHLENRAPRYDTTTATKILSAILEQVNKLHVKDIYHNDLHMDNILISKNNDEISVKIIDFGDSTELNKNLNQKKKQKIKENNEYQEKWVDDGCIQYLFKYIFHNSSEDTSSLSEKITVFFHNLTEYQSNLQIRSKMNSELSDLLITKLEMRLKNQTLSQEQTFQIKNYQAELKKRKKTLLLQENDIFLQVSQLLDHL